MKKRASILGFTFLALAISASLLPANAAKKKPGPTVCIEQGCTGDRCIMCTR